MEQVRKELTLTVKTWAGWHQHWLIAWSQTLISSPLNQDLNAQTLFIPPNLDPKMTSLLLVLHILPCNLFFSIWACSARVREWKDLVGSPGLTPGIFSTSSCCLMVWYSLRVAGTDRKKFTCKEFKKWSGWNTKENSHPSEWVWFWSKSAVWFDLLGGLPVEKPKSKIILWLYLPTTDLWVSAFHDPFSDLLCSTIGTMQCLF